MVKYRFLKQRHKTKRWLKSLTGPKTKQGGFETIHLPLTSFPCVKMSKHKNCLERKSKQSQTAITYICVHHTQCQSTQQQNEEKEFGFKTRSHCHFSPGIKFEIQNYNKQPGMPPKFNKCPLLNHVLILVLRNSKFVNSKNIFLEYALN